MAGEISFWYDFASTYSYLSAMRISDEAEKRDVAVKWRPFLLGPIFAAQGWDTSPFSIYPAKGKNMWRDMQRRCDKYGLPFNRPTGEARATFPQHSVLAARIAHVGLDEGWGIEFSKNVYVAQFADSKNIADPNVLAVCIQQAGGDPEQALNAVGVDSNKAQLRKSVEGAMALGIYGAPSLTIDKELFWGDDRLEDALDWAAKPR